MQDWSGTMLSEALAQRHKLPAFMPVQYDTKSWGGRVRVSIHQIVVEGTGHWKEVKIRRLHI